jgi:hypothetical protein
MNRIVERSEALRVGPTAATQHILITDFDHRKWPRFLAPVRGAQPAICCARITEDVLWLRQLTFQS